MRIVVRVSLAVATLALLGISPGCGDSSDDKPAGLQTGGSGGVGDDGGSDAGGTGGTGGNPYEGGIGGTGGAAGAAGQGGEDSGPACTAVGEALGFQAGCGACLDTSCCDEISACQSDSECLALAQCINECPVTDAGAEAVCKADCATAHPNGISHYNGIVVCGGNGCVDCPF